MLLIKNRLTIGLLLMLTCSVCSAQFLDNFNKSELDKDWLYFTGDGRATMNFVQQEDDFATMYIDANNDHTNIWYAITKRNVSPYLNLKKLKGPDRELRVEARVRIHNPPRRVNIMVNTQRTTDFHLDLMEFELPDTNWHVISMTTRDIDAVPGDSLYIQFNVTDFGWGKYEVDMDYIKADIIDVQNAAADKGIQIPYHPPVPSISTFAHYLQVGEAALLNSDYPQINLNDWHVNEKDGQFRILTVNANQWAIFKWDLEAFGNTKGVGAGVLEITTQSVATGGNYIEAYGTQLGEEFPRLRIFEIFAGDPDWVQERVTYENFMQGKPYDEVFNTQPVYDIKLAEEPGSKNFITISLPVMQRLLNGTTKGLLIRPLGAINASFYTAEDEDRGPKLHFNVVQE